MRSRGVKAAAGPQITPEGKASPRIGSGAYTAVREHFDPRGNAAIRASDGAWRPLYSRPCFVSHSLATSLADFFSPSTWKFSSVMVLVSSFWESGAKILASSG